MKSARLLLVLIALACPLGADCEGLNAEAFRSGVFDPPRMAPNFELTGSAAPTVTLSSYRGKVVALAFGFTHCQQVCPVTLANLAQVSRKLGADEGELQVIFVTVDPERDTPERLHKYLGSFNPGFIGATGTLGQLNEVRQSYGVIATKENSGETDSGYQVHHSSSVYLIDRLGKLRLLVPFRKPVDDILHDVRLLLKK